MLPPLHEWETFYVIIGSSAAALTGLQFVVIALSAETQTVGGEVEFQTFATPTVVHFCSVLLFSAMIAMPGQTQITLGWCITITGALGLGYACLITNAARRTSYKPVFEDWLFHSILPLIAYAAIFVTGLIMYTRPLFALYLIAVCSLLLLFIGIHNAWDAATFMALRRKESQSGSQAVGGVPAGPSTERPPRRLPTTARADAQRSIPE